jgi:PAS domain S-box-containing protein
MVPQSLNSADSRDSPILWESGAHVFRRGWRLGDDGNRRAVLIVAPSAQHPTRSSLDHLTHEYDLKDQLDGAWAVRPLELLRDAGRTALVLENVDGEPLDRLLGAPIEVKRFLCLAIAITATVGKVHQRNLVHKDIKPTNILINVATDEVRLTGFGIASRLARERQSPHPPETIAGTLAYMAPEQTGRMNRSVDSRSDLYSLGVTFYQMLTGALPFAAADAMEWVHCHLARRPVPPAERLKKIPGAVSAIVMRLLAKRAEDRYQTAAGLESDLRNCQTQWDAQRRIDDFSLGEHDTPDRLLIPEKLYGRRREVETLLASFDRIFNGGAPELVLVSGYSGIGKSSVVNELQPVLVHPRGLFASGKFDQYKRDIPYSTLAQAFQSLIRPLLGKSETDLAPWRDALRKTLGPNVGLIVDLFPEMKLIVGEAPPIPEVLPQDGQRRLQLVFRRFIDVFARPEHPLALFLDDLQWLDAATLDLLEDLLSRSDLRNLLLIGAYRDNEVTAAHPLMRKLEAIRAAGRVQDIKLGPLTAEDLGELVADSLHCGLEQAAPLAELVHAKTEGNPFFVIQFLHALTDEELLGFDHAHARWSFDLGGIQAKGYTDNVVEFLAGRLTRLPLETQGALGRLACLGSSADVATLSTVLGKSEEEVHAALWEAACQHLVERRDRSYKFVHDRVQEAAYTLIPEKSRAEAHLTIGRLFVMHTPPEERDEAIFEIVNQLNRGASLITSHEERERLAVLNLAAGKRAEASSAYASALTYLSAGAALLPEDTWQRRQDLAFELELHSAVCEICTGALQTAEECLARLATRASNTVQRCAVARRRVELYTMLGASEQAVDVALECLQHVGVDLPAHPTEAETRVEHEHFWSRLGNRAIEELINLPLMQDPEALAMFDVIARLSLPALYTDQNLYALSVCRAANLILERGNSDAAPYSYAVMGLIAGARFGRHDEGYRLGKMASDLLERRGWNHFGGRAYFFLAVVIPWTRPLGEGIDPARRAFHMAKEHGDPTFAAFASRALTSTLLAVGHPLDQVERQAEEGVEFVQQFGFFLDRTSAFLALVRTLRGRTAKFGSLDDGRFTERLFEQRLTGHPSYAFLECYYWTRKLQARFFASDYTSAVDAADKAERWYETYVALALFLTEMADFYFYSALSRAALCEPLSPDPYAKYREALQRDEQRLRTWAAICPQNFENRAALIGAEIARIEGRELDAERLYEAAIKSARANEFVHNEAIANELAARFHAARGYETIAKGYLREARSCYLRWGADGKVRQLDQLHPHLRQDPGASRPTGTIEAPVEQLDLTAMIEVSQALSSEIVLDKLIEKLMRAAIEHAGAERGLLITPRKEELHIDAEAVTRGQDVIVQLRDNGGTVAQFPESLIRYAMRTRESVLLDDASSQSPFNADPYIVARRARSILCLPLNNQGKLIGILYLENNLTPRVFTPARIAMLKVLASQAAISLENTKAARALKQSDTRYQNLFQAMAVSFFELDYTSSRQILRALRDAGVHDFRAHFKENPRLVREIMRATRVVDVNDQTVALFGRGNKEELLTSVEAFWPEESLDDYVEAVLSTIEGNDKFSTETRVRRLDGTIFDARFTLRYVTEDKTKGLAGVIDITERKRAEEALRESERGLRSVIDGVPGLVATLAPSGEVEGVNRQILEYYGQPLEELRNWGTNGVIHPEDLPYVTKVIARSIASGAPFEFEHRARRFDGEYRWLFARGVPFRDSSGRIGRWFALITDIEERKRAEEALRESEAKFRAAIDGIPGLVGILAPNGDVEAVNRQIYEYCGQSLEELKNWGTNGTVHHEDLPRVTEVFGRSIASGTPYQFEHRLRRFDGEYRWFDDRGVPVRDDSGRIVRWYVLLTDIEDRTQALARLQKMQSDFAHVNRVSIMGELAASLSHEIAQPIGSARNNARAALNFLNRNPPDLSEVREALGCIVNDSDRAGNIIGRIRDQIRKAPPRKDHFDLNAAITEVITLARSAITRNGVSVQTRLAGQLSSVHGDRVQLQQVVLNLVLNAVEAMGSVDAGARELLISTEQDRNGVLVAVRDSGPGIDPARLERVFEAFYTSKPSGTGMGLSICRSIIDAHGGRLWVEANKPRGAVFQFTLPGAELRS